MAKRRSSSSTASIDPSLLASLTVLTDPRAEKSRLHSLAYIVVIAVCAVVSGADNWVDIERWATAKQEWLETLIDLPNGIPSHDPFGRVFAALDPDEFQNLRFWAR